MKRLILLVALLFAFAAKPSMKFKPPTAAERLQAIGSTEGLPKVLARGLDPGDDFEPVPIPQPGDWLAVHHETGQTYDDFVRSGANRPDEKRNKIYLQPLGEFPKGHMPLAESLKDYAAAYFAVDAHVLPPLDIDSERITTRINEYTQKRQLLTGDILLFLKRKLPADAFCLLAITMEDLYPDPTWNFVFGQASLRERVGVYSFARYDPAFYGDKRQRDYEKIVLRRSCKVLAHESCHMFGLMHCIYFRCVLNGSNHLKESDSRPMYLCPVCLRKLHHSVGFDIVERYQKLKASYEKAGFHDEVEWSAKRVKWILADKEKSERPEAHKG
jgi:archaemetzincin